MSSQLSSISTSSSASAEPRSARTSSGGASGVERRSGRAGGRRARRAGSHKRSVPDLDGRARPLLLRVDDLRGETVAPASGTSAGASPPSRSPPSPRTGADHQDRRAGVVLAAEEELGRAAEVRPSEAASLRAWRPARRRIRRRAERRQEVVSPGEEALRRPISCAGRPPRGGSSGRSAGHPRTRVPGSARRAGRRGLPWREGQRCPEVDRIRSARSRRVEASI